MNPGVSQIMLGLGAILGGIVLIKGLGIDLGWLLFVAGVALATRGGILLSQSGAKEIGN
jgi:hypothetical protein